MLIHPHDAATDAEWRAALLAKDFGQLISTADDDGLPIVVPTHFVFDGHDTIELHLAKPNPVCARLETNPRAMVTIIDAYVYIPSSGDVEIVDDPDEVAAILRRQFGHFLPEGGHAPVDAEPDGAYTKLLGAIRGIRLTITGVRAKLKYGGNRTVEQRTAIANSLADRSGAFDAEARDHVMRRLT